MATLSFTSASRVVHSADKAAGLTEAQRSWRTAALAMLSVRVIHRDQSDFGGICDGGFVFDQKHLWHR
jgi:hypothetical protein